MDKPEEAREVDKPDEASEADKLAEAREMIKDRELYMPLYSDDVE